MAPGAAGNESLNFYGGVDPLQSNAFDLGDYAAGDQPTLYFNYLYSGLGSSLQINGVLENGTTIPLSGTLPDTNFGAFRQARIDLSPIVGNDNVRIEFNAGGTQAGVQPVVSIDDMLIGFAERGERVSTPGSGGLDFVGGGFGGNAGQYQLEVRPGVDYTQSGLGGLTNTETFDTNYRFAQEVTLVAPQGSDLRDGDFFELSDGSNTIEFEFNSAGNVTLGRIAIPFTAADSAAVVAGSIIAAINNNSVQTQFGIEAARSSGNETGVQAGSQSDNRINLFGRVVGDFQLNGVSPLNVTAAVEGIAAQQAIGDGITFAGGLNGSGGGIGVFSQSTFNNGEGPGRSPIGLSSGFVVASGDVGEANGPNDEDDTSTTAGGIGDGELDTTFGVVTVDAGFLEFDITVDGSGQQELFIPIVFASEEYNSDTPPSPDPIAVFIDDNLGNRVQLAVLPGDVPINSTTIDTNDPLFINNDLTDGGDFLRQFGYDGFTRVMTLTTAGRFIVQGGQTYSLRFAVGDATSNTIDSALFVGQISTTAPYVNRAADPATLTGTDNANSPGRIVFDAVQGNGLGDANVLRQQSQVILDSNRIFNVDAYGILTEPSMRGTDSVDVLNDPANGVFGNIYVDVLDLGNTGIGAVRNLPVENDSVIGGLAPGAVISNNVIEDAALAGVNVAGELRPLVLLPLNFVDID
ncbi:MAG: choice-of-anchor L domain-containing protein, partial [Planctomycetota bacterium]